MAVLTLPGGAAHQREAGELDEIDVAVAQGANPKQMVEANAAAGSPRTVDVKTGAQDAEGPGERHPGRPELPQHAAARVRRHRALRRRVHHLQHLLDHGRAAHDGVRAAADDRRLTRADPALGRARGAHHRARRVDPRPLRRDPRREGHHRSLQGLRDRPPVSGDRAADAYGDRLLAGRDDRDRRSPASLPRAGRRACRRSRRCVTTCVPTGRGRAAALGPRLGADDRRPRAARARAVRRERRHAASSGLMALGAIAIFIGVALLSNRLVPPIASAIGWPLERLRGVTGRLARENAVRNPSRTAVTAAALMIGLALVTFVTVLAGGLACVDQRHRRQELRGRPRADSTRTTSPRSRPRRDARSGAFREWRSSLRSTPAPATSRASRGPRPSSGIDPQDVHQGLEARGEEGTRQRARHARPARRGPGRRLGQEQRLRGRRPASRSRRRPARTIVLTVRGTVDNKGDVFSNVTDDRTTRSGVSSARPTTRST